MEPYSLYDAFAWYYRRGWGDEFHKQARPVFENHVFPRLVPAAEILDLCCGSGDLSAFLCAAGFRVTGIDGSAEMLRYAREKAPAATFIHADAREFRVAPESFDAVVSTFDSLNHILEIAELECVFRNVRCALREGGFLVFDLNMEEAFRANWHGTFASVDEASAGITRGSYDASTRIGRADVTFFRAEEGGAWSRADICVQERCYEEATIIDALARSGFNAIEARDAYEFGMRAELALGRQFFFAAK